MTMHDATETLHERLDDLRALRDEIRVKAHLAGLDARSAWEQLEPSFLELEQRAARAGHTAAGEVAHAADKLRASFRALKARLDQPPPIL